MPWVLEMEFTPEQAEGIKLYGIQSGKAVPWWYMKQRAALDFPAHWLPKYGRVAVDLTVVEKDGTERTEHHPVGLPDPIANHDKKPEEFAKPIIPGVVKCRVSYTRQQPDFLPIEELHSRYTRNMVTRYLEGCTSAEMKAWLGRVGNLEYDEDVSFGDVKCVKYRFISRAGYDTTVDIYGDGGLNIVY